MLGMTTTNDPGTTGVKDIAEALGGGIKENSLIMIEGEDKSGKSVLTQHIAYGVLHSKGSAVAFYSTEYEAEGLIAQMDSMSLETKHELATDRFRIYKIGPATILQNAEKSLQLIIDHIAALPQRFKLAIVDSPSPFLLRLSPSLKIDFLQTCKELCEQDRTIILVLNTHVFETKTLMRAYMMSDYYLKLKSKDAMLEPGQIDTRVIKFLEVTKLGGAERLGQEGIKFEIKPRTGIQILPFMQVKV
jgi:archaellum biogenesis ATPase FlaH